MSLLGRISKFASSPQGKKLIKQAQQVAKDPRTKEKIDEVRERFAHRDDAAAKKPAADAAQKPQAPAAQPPSSAHANPPADEAGPPPGASS